MTNLVLFTDTSVHPPVRLSVQTHRGAGTADWRGDLLAAVQRVLMGERGVLKSALYSQLDELPTSDAILHLNQLEHRLAEQVGS